MIIVKFQGGLGNQMFQYAFYKALNHKYPLLDIKADITDYQMCNYHNGFELKKLFKIRVEKASKWELLVNSYSNIPFVSGKNKLFRYINYAANKIISFFRNIISPNSIILCGNSTPTVFDEKFLNIEKDKNYYMEGFWCNEKYFIDIKKKIMEAFSFGCIYKDFDKYLLRNNLNGYDLVSVHVRRGDYLDSAFDVVDTGYYKRAIDYMSSYLDNPFFVFFTDDIEYVSQTFDFLPNKIIVDKNRGEDSYKDMMFMSLCNHNIIANSTFSFWGAYLNNNSNKIVIAPDRFSSAVVEPLACKDWIVMKSS